MIRFRFVLFCRLFGMNANSVVCDLLWELWCGYWANSSVGDRKKIRWSNTQPQTNDVYFFFFFFIIETVLLLIVFVVCVTFTLTEFLILISISISIQSNVIGFFFLLFFLFGSVLKCFNWNLISKHLHISKKSNCNQFRCKNQNVK